MKKRSVSGRKGYFFLIDSILALGVLVVGGFLIFSSYAQAPPKEDATILAESLVDFFSNTKVKDANNPYAGIGGELWKQGMITNGENTLLQQLGEFYAKNDLATAEKFISNLTKNSIPQQYLFEFRMNDTLIYPKFPSQDHTNSKNAALVLIPSKKLVYGFLDEETGDLFGPYKAEALVWRII